VDLLVLEGGEKRMVLSEQASEYNWENIKEVGRRCCFFTHPPLFSQGIRSHNRTLEGSSGRTYHPFDNERRRNGGHSNSRINSTVHTCEGQKKEKEGESKGEHEAAHAR